MFERLPFDPIETIACAKTGDKDALSRIWTLLNPALIRFLASLGSRSPEDIASESWVSLAKVLPRFQGDMSALQGLLFQIARARLYDEFRRQSRQEKFTLRLVEGDNVPNIANSISDPELEDSSSQVLQWLSEIPTTQAEVVSLRVIVGMSHFEISQIIGKSEGAVRILFFRGLENLEKVVTGEKKPKSGKKFSSLA